MKACVKCLCETECERHHVFPKRWRRAFPPEKHHVTVILCHECHVRLEKLIGKLEKHLGRLPDEVYHHLAHNQDGGSLLCYIRNTHADGNHADVLGRIQQQPKTMKRPDFFCKDFHMKRKLFCEKCKAITEHSVQVIADSPKDNGVPTLRACMDCYAGHKKLQSFGVESKPPVLYQRFFVTAYVFLVLHEHYLD